jgi:hypothetical protein
MGKVAEDEAALYLMALEDVSGGGESALMAGTVGATLIHHRIVTYNMYTVYQDEETFAMLLPAVKQVLADTVLANPE